MAIEKVNSKVVKAAVAPGQSVVLYDGSRVVGSATIARTGTAAR